MAKFIKVHKEVLKGEIKFEPFYVNIDHIVHVGIDAQYNKCVVRCSNDFIIVKESPDEIMERIRSVNRL